MNANQIIALLIGVVLLLGAALLQPSFLSALEAAIKAATGFSAMSPL